MNRNIRIIASDFDGTLRRNGEVSANDRNAVEKWRRSGRLFGLVTGRDVSDALTAVEQSGGMEFDFIICCSGAYIIGGDGSCIFETSADCERLSELCGYILDKSPMWLSRCCGKEKIGVPVGFNSGKAVGIVDKSEKRLFLTADDFSREDLYNRFHILHTAIKPAELASECADGINRRFEGYVTAFQNGESLDIVRYGVSKSYGIRQLVKYLGMSDENVITVGDNFNDIEMIRDFCGCAVSSGKDAAKNAATAVYDGISEMISAITG